MNFKSLIRTIPDFPKPGIQFRDITPLLASGVGFRHIVDLLAQRYVDKVDKVVGIEARGFLFGAAIAYKLGAGFVPIRKPGKLPHASIGSDYQLEYGTGRVEMHVDGISRGERIAIVDDLLATGGTAVAALDLVERSGADVVECGFVVELPELQGRKRIEARGARVHALCTFTDDER